MEISTISNDTMNITCTDTASETRNLIRLVEDLQQELHKLKLQLKSTECIKVELEVEVEKLESQNKLLQKAFETEKTELTNFWSNRLSKLQVILEEERGQNSTDYAALQKKYEELKDLQEPKTEGLTDCLGLKEELKQNQLEVIELKKDLQASKETVCSVECTNIELQERIHILEKELDENKEALKCKTDSLLSTLKALEDMKDDKALLSSELAVLKAGPIEDRGRGNSLFSEVDDKRQNLEKKFALLHKKYLESKKALAMSASELEKLKRENIKFQLLWEEGDSKLQTSEKKLIESYKEKIKEFLHRIKELESRPENPQIVTISDKDLSNMDWIHTIVDQARAEARELRQALQTKSMEKLFADENIYLLTAEVTHLKRQAMKDQALIEDLNMRLSSLEKSSGLNESSPNQEQQEQSLNVEKKPPNVKAIRFAPDVKENDGVPLKRENKKKEV